MTIYGCDTSHRQPLGNFPAMKASGRCDFLIAKATEGVGFADPQYAASRAGAKAAGIVFGSYHFARPGDPIAQADYYLSVAKPVAGEIAVLDIEDTAIPDAGNWSAAWCSRVKSITGTAPMVYTYPNYLATHDFRPVVALGVPLWFADYNDPLNPLAPWSTYAVRQFTDKGTVPGQPGTLDCDSSPLTLDQLRGLAIGGQEDDMPTAEEFWDQVITDPRVGMNAHAVEVMGDIFFHTRQAASAAQAALTKATAMEAAVEALAAAKGADPAEIKQTVSDAVAAALKDLTITLSADGGAPAAS